MMFVKLPTWPEHPVHAPQPPAQSRVCRAAAPRYSEVLSQGLARSRGRASLRAPFGEDASRQSLQPTSCHEHPLDPSILEPEACALPTERFQRHPVGAHTGVRETKAVPSATAPDGRVSGVSGLE